MLIFASLNDLTSVLSKLDSAYEAYNTNYENQYPGYTADQLDAKDAQTGFDNLKTYKDFELLFPSYTSKRSVIYSTESTWITNNFTGTDPDDIDYFFDNGENAIFSNAYKLKVGNALYEMKVDGLYINGVLYTPGDTSPTTSCSDCCTNRRIVEFYQPPTDNTKKYKLKKSIYSIPWIGSVRAKIVSYKSGSGRKRVRSNLSLTLNAQVYGFSCQLGNSISIEKLNKKRRELKVINTAGPLSYYKTYKNETYSINVMNGTTEYLYLTW